MNYTTNPLQLANAAQSIMRYNRGDKMSIAIQYVAVGCLFIIAIGLADKMVKDLKGENEQCRGR